MGKQWHWAGGSWSRPGAKDRKVGKEKAHCDPVASQRAWQGRPRCPARRESNGSGGGVILLVATLGAVITGIRCWQLLVGSGCCVAAASLHLGTDSEYCQWQMRCCHHPIAFQLPSSYLPIFSYGHAYSVHNLEITPMAVALMQFSCIAGGNLLSRSLGHSQADARNPTKRASLARIQRSPPSTGRMAGQRRTGGFKRISCWIAPDILNPDCTIRR